jgi:hypothetical protein
MDGCRDKPSMTAGLDLGDKYSYLRIIDTVSGEGRGEHHVKERGKCNRLTSIPLRIRGGRGCGQYVFCASYLIHTSPYGSGA